jgi:hypothetical protein
MSPFPVVASAISTAGVCTRRRKAGSICKSIRRHAPRRSPTGPQQGLEPYRFAVLGRAGDRCQGYRQDGRQTRHARSVHGHRPAGQARVFPERQAGHV